MQLYYNTHYIIIISTLYYILLSIPDIMIVWDALSGFIKKQMLQVKVSQRLQP